MPKLKNIKKMLLLFIIIFTLTGCNTSYKSLNDMGIVSSLIIDKENDKYKVDIEIYKETKESSKKEAYFVSGKGKHLKDALDNASLLVGKNLYFTHINAIIVSKKAIDGDMKTIFNYLSRRIDLNSNYYILVTDDTDKLLKSEDKDNPILGEKIKNLTDFSTNNGAILKYDFLEKLYNYVNPRIDVVLNKITTNNKKIKINEAYFFDEDDIAGSLNQEEVKLVNLFSGNNNIILDFKIDDKYYILKIDKSNLKIDVKNNISINFNINANLDNVDEDYDLTKTSTITKLNKHASNSLEKKYKKLINKLKENNSDILRINNEIYKINGYQKYDYYKDKIEVNVNVKISKKGLMQNTIGGYKNG